MGVACTGHVTTLSSSGQFLDGEFGDENAVMVEAPPPVPLPYQVQIIDSQTVSEGLRPYIVYVILTRREGEGEQMGNDLRALVGCSCRKWGGGEGGGGGR